MQRIRLSVIPVLVAMALAVGKAAIVPQQGGTQTFLPKTTVAIPANRTFNVVLIGSTPARNWLVGVIPDETERIQFAAAVVTGTQNSGPLGAIEAVPPDNVEVLPGEVRIRGLSEFSGGVLFFVKAPPSVTVSVVTDSLSHFRGKVGGGVAIRNGLVVAEQPRNFGHLLGMLTTEKRNPPPQKLPTGEYLVAAATLRAHVSRIVMPEPPFGMESFATVMITIDEQGRVSRIQKLRGDPGFLEAVEQAVRQWAFRPIRVEGSTVVAVSHIAFSTKDGRVFSSMTD
jgi:TonB family protein